MARKSVERVNDEQPNKHSAVRFAIVAALIAVALVAAGFLWARNSNATWTLPNPAEWWQQLRGGEGNAGDPPAPQASSDNPPDALTIAASYAGVDEVAVGDGVPDFSAAELQMARESFERYVDLDELGRCTVCVASVGPDTMPGADEQRASIGAVRPSGWQTVRYDDLIEDRYLFNRCHLIAYALTAENDRPENLVTGTSHLNKQLMLPREIEVARYVEKTANHVLYRATPLFLGQELVCRAVRLEAMSVEDGGEGLAFDVVLFNVQPGIGIDYATGLSWRTDESSSVSAHVPTRVVGQDDSEAESRFVTVAVRYDALSAADGLGSAGASGYSRDGLVLPERVSLVKAKFLINVNSSKFHTLTCQWATEVSARNAWPTDAGYAELVAAGFSPCSSCL